MGSVEPFLLLQSCTPRACCLSVFCPRSLPTETCQCCSSSASPATTWLCIGGLTWSVPRLPARSRASAEPPHPTLAKQTQTLATTTTSTHLPQLLPRPLLLWCTNLPPRPRLCTPHPPVLLLSLTSPALHQSNTDPLLRWFTVPLLLCTSRLLLCTVPLLLLLPSPTSLLLLSTTNQLPPMWSPSTTMSMPSTPGSTLSKTTTPTTTSATRRAGTAHTPTASTTWLFLTAGSRLSPTQSTGTADTRRRWNTLARHTTPTQNRTQPKRQSHLYRT